MKRKEQPREGRAGARGTGAVSGSAPRTHAARGQRDLSPVRRVVIRQRRQLAPVIWIQNTFRFMAASRGARTGQQNFRRKNLACSGTSWCRRSPSKGPGGQAGCHHSGSEPAAYSCEPRGGHRGVWRILPAPVKSNEPRAGRTCASRTPPASESPRTDAAGRKRDPAPV